MIKWLTKFDDQKGVGSDKVVAESNQGEIIIQKLEAIEEKLQKMAEFFAEKP